MPAVKARRGGATAARRRPAATLSVTTGLRSWWKADAITGVTSGSGVSSWTDSQGSNPLAQATSSQRPVYRTSGTFLPNGKPVLEFTPSSATFLTSAGTPNSGATTRVVVLRQRTQAAGSDDRQSLFASPSGYEASIVSATGALSFASNGGGGELVSSLTPIPLDTWVALTYVTDGSTGGTLYLNGVQVGINSATFTASGTGMDLGGRGNSTRLFDGYIAEMLDYSDAKTSADVTLINNYLLAKYNLQPTSTTVLYVATTGSNSNPGTDIAAPKLTIQNALNAAQPGTLVYVRAGTYNESLSLPRSGLSTARITLQNYNGETVTVDSGTSYAIRTNNARAFWTIDGIRFVSLPNPGRYPQSSVNFSDNDESSNDNIFRNCYVQGEIHITGKRNLVENCEFTGMVGTTVAWFNGFHDSYPTSTDNVCRNNHIHDFQNRAIWTMMGTARFLAEGNLCHDIGPAVDGDTPVGINFDGASMTLPFDPVARNNIVYNVTSYGVSGENSLRGIIEGNTIHDIDYEPIIYGNYHLTQNDAIIRNNVIYHSTFASGIRIGGNGMKVQNNTIHSIGGGIVIGRDGDGNWANGTEVSNNIFSSTNTGFFYDGTGSTSTGEVFRNNLYFNTNSATMPGETNKLTATNPLFVNAATFDFHLQSGSPARGTGVALTGVTVDRDGTTRADPPSRGAYE